MIRSIMILIAVCTLFCGLALAQQAAPVNQNAAAVQRPMGPIPIERPSLGELMAANGGSLLRASLAVTPDPSVATLKQVSFFAVPDPEPRTMKKHDLVTIIIREESEITSDGTSDLKKNADLDMRVNEFIKLKPKNFAIQGGALGASPPAVSATGSRNFKGEAKVDRTDTFVARIQAEVVDVKPNGTFVVQARKRIKHDEEEQEFILTGVCRGADVTPDNTVLSTQVFDLQLTHMTKGAVSDTTGRGWVPKLLDFVNPF